VLKNPAVGSTICSGSANANSHPALDWQTNTPAGTLVLQLEIVYLPCVPDPNNLAARYIAVAPGNPSACPFIYLKRLPGGLIPAPLTPRPHDAKLMSANQ
jgi:hypothetical protein